VCPNGYRCLGTALETWVNSSNDMRFQVGESASSPPLRPFKRAAEAGVRTHLEAGFDGSTIRRFDASKFPAYFPITSSLAGWGGKGDREMESKGGASPGCQIKSRGRNGVKVIPPLLISRDFRSFSRESDFCALVSGLPMFGRPGSGCSAMEESEGEIRSWPVGSLEELADAKIGGDEKRKGGPRNRTAFLVRLVAEMGAQRVAPRQAIGVV
jgi:hypothetical protein